MSKLTPKIVVGDWNSVAHAIAKLDQSLNSGAAPTFLGLTLKGGLDMTGNPITDLGYIDFDITASPGDGPEGRMKWNANEHTADLTTGLGPVLQIGQESFVLVYNGTGSTIYNGTAVHPVGAVGGRPSVAVAAADTHVTFRGVVLVTTMDIPDGTVGVVSQDGKVRGVDTSGFDLGTYGNVIWLANDGEGILNNVTNIRPSFPSYAVQLGGIAVQDAADGVLQLEIVGKATDTTQNFWNGTFREKFDFRVTESAGTVTGTLTPSNGHPDMTMIFSDGLGILDTDPGATIDITAYVGTDTAPVTAYVYIPVSTKVLTVDVAWPVGEHIRVATLVLQSAVTTGTSGALRNQNWNDEIQDTDTNQGHLAHLGQRLRAIEAEWNNGAEATLTVADTANSYVSITSGKVFQMHEQTYPALAMPAENMEVVNDPDGSYTPITSLNEITKTSDGGTIPNNRWISVVIWGVCNKSGETSHLMCNVPAGDYTSEANAQIDSLGYSNYNIPKMFKGVGFLIARFTVQRKTSTIAYGGGDSYQDLRGFIPNSTAGSGAGASGITTFLGLIDTPASFVDQALKIPQVNAGETALEFLALTAIDHNTLTNYVADQHIDWKAATDDLLTTGTAIIGGGTNTTQLYVKANASQTGPHITLLDSSGSGLADIYADGTNLGFGSQVFDAITTAIQNFAIGPFVLNDLTEGNRNTGLGDGALSKLIDGDDNLGIGKNALANGTGMSDCTVVGNSAFLNVLGNSNTGVGFGVGQRLINASSNVLMGRLCCGQSTSDWDGSSNTCVGTSCGLDLGITGIAESQNTMVGARCGQNAAGSGHVFMGYRAGTNETGDNKLYIENSNSASPLLYGEFDNNLLTVNGTLSATGNVGIGTVAFAAKSLFVWQSALDTAVAYAGIHNVHTKSAGATTFAHDMFSFQNAWTINQVGGECGSVYGVHNTVIHTAGDVGAVGNERNLYGLFSKNDLNAGTVNGAVYGIRFELDQEAAHTITGDAFGMYLFADFDGTVTGTATLLRLVDQTGVDYCIYQTGNAPNHFGGSIEVRGGNISVGADNPSGIPLYFYHSSTNSIALFESGDAAAQIYFKDSSTTSNTSVGIGCLGDDLRFLTSSGGTVRMRLSAAGGVYIKEIAAADADAANYGQLWVKNTTPCQLWFTDDLGNDTQIV
jgi:hypothetical protein